MVSPSNPSQQLMMDFTYASSSVLISFGVLSYLAICALYRLYLSPLAKFPGPKIAALTGWYERYYDVMLNGEYIFEIERMHQKYGEFFRDKQNTVDFLPEHRPHSAH